MQNSQVDQAVRPVFVGPEQGEAVWAMSSLFDIKLDGSASAGGLAVMEVVQPPGVATPCTSTATRPRRSSFWKAR